MSQVTGRSTETRTIGSVGTTNTSAAITGPAGSFNKGDAGRPISGTGIPAATTVLSVTSGTAATLSANATATGTITATVTRNNATDQSYGYFGWSPESDAESQVYGVTGSQASPDRLANAVTRVDMRSR